MKTQTAMSVAMAAALILCSAASAEDVQWVRVTVVLEAGSQETPRPQDMLIPGGVYSLEEVNERGMAAIDEEILERLRNLGDSMRAMQEAMRLGTLLARQYYLPLEVGKESVLPVVDLNPRLSVVFTPERFVGDLAVCKVQILEPEGPMGTSDFTGDPITLRLQNADLQEVLRTFSKVAPVQIVVDPSVVGSVTVDLRDVPWDQALDLVLRSNGLGWTRENGTIRVAPRTEMSSRKRVRTEATLRLQRGSWGSVTVASPGDEHNPTMVLLVESVQRPPGLVAERDGLVHPRRVLPVAPFPDDLESTYDEMAVFRATETTDGELRDAEILASPSPAYAERLLRALREWRFRTVLDEEGRKLEAVIGYGVRINPQPVFVNLGEVAHIGVDAKAEPAPGHPDQYVIKVIVTDLDTGKVLTAPQVVTLRGGEANIRSGLRAPNGDDSTFNMRFLISEDGKTVSYSWTITTAGTIVASNSAEFTL
jgi:hypothetical protein